MSFVFVLLSVKSHGCEMYGDCKVSFERYNSKFEIYMYWKLAAFLNKRITT